MFGIWYHGELEREFQVENASFYAIAIQKKRLNVSKTVQ